MPEVQTSNKMIKLTDPKLRWIVLIPVLVFTILIYYKSIHYGFVNLDDNINIFENNDLKNTGIKGIIGFFNKTYIGMYVPFTMISYSIDYHLAGLAPNQYHLTNLILHLANLIVLFYFILLLTNNLPISTLAVSIFALHPMNVESVAWISTRSTLLCFFFLFLSMILYLKYIREPHSIIKYLLSFFFFIFALLSKSQAIMLPFILMLLDYYESGKFTLRDLLNKIPFFLVALFFGFLTLHFRAKIDPTDLPSVYSLFDRVFIATWSMSFYYLKFFIPVNLAIIHPFPLKFSGLLPYIYYFSSAIILFYLFFFIFIKKINKIVVFGLLFFTLNLLLVINVVPFFTRSIAAERYAYFAYPGFCVLLSFIVFKIFKWETKYTNKIRVLLSLAILLFLIILSNLTFSRLSVWKNSLTLWNDEIKKYPVRSAVAYCNRAIARDDLSDYHKAIRDYDTAIIINPLYIKAFIYRADDKKIIGDYTGAVSDYSRSLYLNPFIGKIWYLRAELKLFTGDSIGACQDYKQSQNLNFQVSSGSMKFPCQ